MNVRGDFQTPPALAARADARSGAISAAAAHAFPNADVVGIVYQHALHRRAERTSSSMAAAYSLAPWKLAVAGVYTQPRLRVVGSRTGRPVDLATPRISSRLSGKLMLALWWRAAKHQIS